MNLVTIKKNETKENNQFRSFLDTKKQDCFRESTLIL